MIRFWITVEIILCITFCICGGYLIKSLNEATDQENIQNFIKLTESYRQAVDAFKNNVQQSNELIPRIKTSVDDMTGALQSIKSFSIKIPGLKKIEPFKNNKTIQNSIDSFKKTSLILTNYNEQTAPALIASLEQTSNNLYAISSSVQQQKEKNMLYIILFLASIISVFAVNIIIITIFNKKLQLLEDTI